MNPSVCVETFLADSDLKDRFKLVRDFGIEWVELWTLNDRDPAAVRADLDTQGLGLTLFCANLSHSLIDPAERPGFLEELGESGEKARTLGCTWLALLTNRVDSKGIPEPPPGDLSETEQLLSYYEGVRQAFDCVPDSDIGFLIEPLNTRVDHPGYFLDNSRLAFDLVRSLGNPRLKVLFDIYHLQIMEGNLIETIEKNLDLIGHIHVADVPGRHEPGTGEIHYERLADALRANGYPGKVGLECFPEGDPAQAISQFKALFG